MSEKRAILLSGFVAALSIGTLGGAALADAIPVWVYFALLLGHCAVSWWALKVSRRDHARFMADFDTMDAKLTVQNARMEGTLIGLQRGLGQQEVTLQ